MTDDWLNQAACRTVDTDLFFPQRGEPTEQAKQICRRCPVRPECLTAAMRDGEHYGIWGGFSERERRQLRRQYERLIVQ